MATILFIEDETALQTALTNMLTDRGYTILTALTGVDGIKKAESDNPDLIILDIILPKKNGLEVLEELKNNSQTKHIPVVILTNLEGSDEVEKALSLGAKSYLVKANYSLEEVCKKVEESLAEKSS